ncbi:hypothetical protein M0R45_021160 [Rubus argutus]|uniref:Uncharacterized protein n=1 Tax=Rubus argutus TaxID=59490 RepID=A0AAW1XE39_RUBAR
MVASLQADAKQFVLNVDRHLAQVKNDPILGRSVEDLAIGGAKDQSQSQSQPQARTTNKGNSNSDAKHDHLDDVDVNESFGKYGRDVSVESDNPELRPHR